MDRIKELEKEFEDLKKEGVAAENRIKEIQVRLIKIQGIVEELNLTKQKQES